MKEKERENRIEKEREIRIEREREREDYAWTTSFT